MEIEGLSFVPHRPNGPPPPSALGKVHTSTMRVFDVAQFAELVEKVPKM